MQRRSVLFPEPERPKTTTTCPGWTSRFTSFSTSCPLKDFHRFSTRTAGAFVGGLAHAFLVVAAGSR